MKNEDQVMKEAAIEAPDQTMGESLIDVLSLEVLGPLSRALYLMDSDQQRPENAFYVLRDACILARQHLDAICDVIGRDIGDVQIVATWGNDILNNRTYDKAFIGKEG